jgi:hypothetical protein
MPRVPVPTLTILNRQRAEVLRFLGPYDTPRPLNGEAAPLRIAVERE